MAKSSKGPNLLDSATPTEKQKDRALSRALKKIEAELGSPRQPERSAEEIRTRPERNRRNREPRTSEVWFEFYDPYASVVNTKRPAFRNFLGEKLEFRTGFRWSCRQLLVLAVDAEKLITMDLCPSREEWMLLLSNVKHYIQISRDEIPIDSLTLVDGLGESIAVLDREEIDAFNVLWLGHQVFMARRGDGIIDEDPQMILLFRTFWALVALKELDNAVLAMLYEDAGDGIAASILATQALANAKSLEFTRVLPFRRAMAQSGARAKLKNDPKQIAKSKVKASWAEWTQKRPNQYRNKTQFAKDMLRENPQLENQAVIVRWCTTWEEEAQQ